MTDLIATVETDIDAPAGKVWKALTEPDLIAQYMMGTKVTTDWKEGSSITYEGEWKGTQYRDKGTVLEVVPNKMLKTTHYSPLGGKPDVPENYNTVTYELADADGRTTLTVIQENNPDQAMVDESEKTWAMMLQELKSVVQKMP